MDVKRRTVLLSGLTVLGAGPLGYGAALLAGAAKSCPASNALADLAAPAIRKIGEIYLRTGTSPAEERRLRQSAGRLARASGAGASERLMQAAAVLAASSPQDFAAGDVVFCDGWMLARSEARACALIALGMTREFLA